MFLRKSILQPRSIFPEPKSPKIPKDSPSVLSGFYPSVMDETQWTAPSRRHRVGSMTTSTRFGGDGLWWC